MVGLLKYVDRAPMRIQPRESLLQSCSYYEVHNKEQLETLFAHKKIQFVSVSVMTDLYFFELLITIDVM